MKSSTVSFLASLLVLTSGTVESAFAQKEPGQHKKPTLTPLIEQTIRWLPQDTENIVVARRFKMPATPKAPVSKKENASDAYARAFQLFAMGSFPLLKKGAYSDQLAGRKITLALGGQRRFDVTSSFGELRYQGCHILIFEDPLGKAGDKLMQSLRQNAIAVRRILGHDVHVFDSTFVREPSIKKKDWEGVFIVRPEPNILLCATNEAYLREVLQHRQNKQGKRALPDDLPEWRHLDVTASAWLVRHLSKDTPAVGNRVRSASGLVMMLKPNGREALEVVYIPAKKGAEERTLKLAKERWHRPEFGLAPAIRQGGTGTAIVTVSLQGMLQDDPGYVFVLFASMGDDFILRNSVEGRR